MSVENHHNKNNKRPGQSFQWIQEEDRGTLRNDEEEASQGECQVATLVRRRQEKRELESEK